MVEEDGFKTVFVLRLAPILPIPLGAYSYVYGTSKLNPNPSPILNPNQVEEPRVPLPQAR